MKKNALMFFAAAAAVMFAICSCVKEEIGDNETSSDETVFTATLPEQTLTKTVLGSDGKTVTWNSYDWIYLMYYDTEWKMCQNTGATISEDGKVASYTVPSSCADKVKWAMYPSAIGASSCDFVSCDNENFLFRVNDYQYEPEFRYAQAMVAKVDGTHIPFSNACGIFSFNITNDALDKNAQTVRVIAPGIGGEIKIGYDKSGKIQVQRNGEGYPIVDGNFKDSYRGFLAGPVYISVRPGTYEAGSITIQYLNNHDDPIISIPYDRELTVTPGMLVNWGDLLGDHADVAYGLIPETFIEDITSIAGNAENVTAIEFVANSPGEAGPTETHINSSTYGPPVYASFKYGKVTVRTPAKKLYKSEWNSNDDYSGFFLGMVNLESVTGWNNVEMKGVTDVSGLFYKTKIKSFDFSQINTSTIKWAERMFASTEIEEIDFAGADFSSLEYMNYMFYCCEKLKSVKMEGLDLSSVYRMNYMFGYCNSLESVSMKGTVFKNLCSVFYMFCDCSSLTSLDMSGVPVQKITYMSGLFRNCSKLTSVDLGWMNTENVQNMGSVFEGCARLESVNLSGFNTEKVTTFEKMFCCCYGLKSVDLSSFRTPALTYCTDMFFNCYELSSVNLSNMDVSNVTDFSSMFYWCRKLTSLDLSNFDTSNATNMSGMMENAELLSSLVLGKKFHFKGNFSNVFGNRSDNTLIGGENTAGEYYTSITCTSTCWGKIEDILGSEISHYEHITLPMAEFPAPAALAPLIKELGDKIGGNDNIKTITFVAESSKSVSGEVILNPGADAAVTIYASVDTKGNVTVRTPATGFKMNADSRYFFSSNADAVRGKKPTSLTKITGLELVSTEGVTQMDNMFLGCTSLVSADFSNFTTSSVTSYNSMFRDCSSLKTLDLSSFTIGSTAPLCGRVFDGCSSLTSLNLSSFSSDVGNSSYMFRGCASLATLRLGKDFNVTGLRAGMFDNMGTNNTSSAYYTTLYCGQFVWSLLQDQQPDLISHYKWEAL